jgi:mxaL protein
MIGPKHLDLRLSLLSGAFALTLFALAGPSMSPERRSFDTLALVDITGSMNTRDYLVEGKPVSRLDYIKSALHDFIAGLPCGSRFALGVFAERRSFLLFEPVEVCADYAPLAGALKALDWRMAWEGDSRISSGLFRGIGDARQLGVNLIFFTDGQEAPPLPFSGPPPFEGRIGEVRGLIVGVGGYELSPIPKFDDNGREIGFYGVEDVPHDNRFGLPPEGAEQREGYNARNAPFGAEVVVGVEHLSSVREPYLLSLSEKTGLSYTHLTDAHRLLGAFEAAAAPRYRPYPQSLRPALGEAAAVLLIALYVLLPVLEMLWRKRLRSNKNTASGRQI